MGDPQASRERLFATGFGAVDLLSALLVFLGVFGRETLRAYLELSKAVSRFVRTKRLAPHSGEVNFYYGLPRQRPSQV